MTKMTFVALLALLFGAGQAMAKQCEAGSVTAQQVGIDTYNPASLANPVLQVSLRLLEDCEPQSGAIALAARAETGFNVRGPGGVLVAKRLASPHVVTSNPVRFVLTRDAMNELKSGRSLTIDLLEFAAGQFVLPGTYLLDLEIVLNGAPTQVVPVAIEVVPVFQLIGDTIGGALNVDFGPVEAGAQAQRTIMLRSNARLTMQLVSDNRGTLRHERGTAYGAIPYSMSVDGRAVDLSGQGSIRLPYQQGGAITSRVDLAVDPVSEKYAGTYRDIVTINFVAD